MKKFLGLTLSLVLIICVFSACGDDSNKYITDNGENSQASSLNSTASGESKPDNSKGNASTGTNQTNNSSKNDKTESTEN
ncbi:MAG: hypothetical protein IKT38_03545, partial [Clostridia bacterium]|nr:hypothetical protein [Clostridia bacterium]MBR6509660.1 hypothetical protein [Clostridia bacterium]